VPALHSCCAYVLFTPEVFNSPLVCCVPVSIIMRPLLASRRARVLSRVAMIACLTLGAAACSSDRFADHPLSNQYASQSPASTVGSSPTVARLDTQTLRPAEPLPSPQADRSSRELTGSIIPAPRPF